MTQEHAALLFGGIALWICMSLLSKNKKLEERIDACEKAFNQLSKHFYGKDE